MIPCQFYYKREDDIKMDKRLLINRKFNTADYPDIKDNWYAAREILLQYKSVQSFELCDTTSSAGDWSGVIVQRLNGNTYIIPWGQENNYPHAGYTVYTGEVFCECDGTLTQEDINQIITDYYNQEA